MNYESLLALRARRKENGLCIICGDKLPSDCTFATCETCRASNKARRQSRKENGLCAACGNKLPDGYTDVTCEDCKNYQNSYRRLLKREQRCVCCRKQDAYTLNNRSLCAECSERITRNERERLARNAEAAERKNARSKEVYTSRKENGLCVKCGRKLPEGECHVSCPSCRAWSRRYYARAADKRYGSGRLTRQNVSTLGICSACFKAPAERGKLCESCYEKHLVSLSIAKEVLQKNRASHPWVAAEGARLEEVRRRHGWEEKRFDKK